MPSDTKIADLLLRWEEHRRQGQSLSINELCQDCPELSAELKRRVDALSSLDPLLRLNPSSHADTQATSHPLVGTLRPADPLPTNSPLQDQPATTSDAPANEEPRRAAPELHDSVAPLPPLRPGSEPVPGYQLVARLGRGGFGEVWKAVAPGGFSVALKLVPLHEKVGATELHALEIVKSFRHPNLLTAFGAWQRDDLLIVAMELADCTLWDRFQEACKTGSPGIPFEELLEYLREAAKGIDYLNQPHHSLGGKENVSIQHRDIKPQNILLVGSGVKVADFGLVRLLEHALTSHTGTMTPAYAAPEFLRGQTSNQSDQYCLAVTYCELRGGRLPFEGSHAQVMSGHLLDPPDLTMLPEHERPVVAKALSKEPTDRWPTCRAFVEALAGTHIGNRAEAVAPASLAAVKGRSVSEPRAAASGSRRLIRWLSLTLIVGALIIAALYLPVFVPRWFQTNSAENLSRRATELHINREASEERSRVAPQHDQFNESGVDQEKTASAAAKQDETPDPPEIEATSPTVITTPNTVSPAEQRSTIEASPTIVQQPVGELFRFEKHQGGVRSVSVSQNGRHILSAGDDRVIWLWDLESGEGIHRFEGHSEVVNCVVYSSDGQRALSGSDDHTVRLWDVDRRISLGTFKGHTEPVYGVAFSSDGLRAVSAGKDMTVRIWDVEKQTEVNQFGLSDESIWSLAFSSKNCHLLTASDSNVVRLWDVETGSEVHRFEDHQDVVWCVALSPDGRFALTGGGLNEGSRDFALRLWDIELKTRVHELKGHTGAIGSVAFSPDGRRAISGSVDKTVRLWDVDTGSELRSFEDHTDVVYCVAFSRDGQRALSASRDGSIRVWGLPR